MRIGGLQKVSFIDFPDRIAAVVFTQGCNWRCPFCHNRELVEPARFGREIPVENILAYLRSRQDRLDGVVISGGEPTIHPELPHLVKSIHEMGYAVKLDTNGSHPEVLENLIDSHQLEYVAMDVKSSSAQYNKLAGCAVNITKLRRSMWLLRESSINYELRTTIVPGLHSLEDIYAISDMVAGCKRFVIQTYVPNVAESPELATHPAFTPEVLSSIRNHFSHQVEAFEIRNNQAA